MSNLGLSTAGDLICKSGMLELQIDSFGYLEWPEWLRGEVHSFGSKEVEGEEIKWC